MRRNQYSVEQIIGILKQHENGRPIVTDNGPEFASKALHAWAYRRGITLHFIEPGKPVQNAFIESFNGTCRDDCLNQELFVDVPDAKRKIERWRQHHRGPRPCGPASLFPGGMCHLTPGATVSGYRGTPLGDGGSCHSSREGFERRRTGRLTLVRRREAGPRESRRLEVYRPLSPKRRKGHGSGVHR